MTTESTAAVEIEDIYPLAPTQAGMLFHSLADPTVGMYFEQMHGTIRSLDTAAFERAWQQVVDHHPILRTALNWEDVDKPVQIVCRNVELPWEHMDWRGLPESDQAAQLQAHLRSEQEQGFDLNAAPLMRGSLIQISDDVHQFVWHFHHIILDGWSVSRVLKRVWDLYRSIGDNQDLRIEPCRPYRDHIAWLQQRDMAAAERFWRQKLEGFSAPNDLRVTRPPSASPEQGSGYGLERLDLSAQTSESIRRFARQHGLTASTVAQGAWALLLSRYSAETDIVFGVTVSGRSPEVVGVEDMVGLFINTLPLRVPVESDTSVPQWLEDLQHRQVELAEYEYSSLVDVQRCSDVRHGEPLFKSIYVFENYTADGSIEKWGEQAGIRDICFHERANYPLAIIVVPGSSWSLRISYDRRHFDRDTIRRMLGHLQTILESILADPQQAVRDITMLTSEEHRFLDEQRGEPATASGQASVLDVIGAHAESSAGSPALRCGEEQLTYGELDQRATQLARRLREHGVSPGVMVGLCVSRSPDLIVAILGILRAGGAYVPIDPTYPPQRLRFILQDTGAPVVVTQQVHADCLTGYAGSIVCLDGAPATNETSDDVALPLPSADDPAYVIYTSGSTGTPKGVLISHGNLMHSTSARLQVYADAAKRFLLIPSFAFDSSVATIFWTLCQGGCLIIPREDEAKDPSRLAALIQREHVTHLLTLPSLYKLILDEVDSESASHLNTAIVAGEACPRSLIDQHRRTIGAASLFNEYGPTEGTVWSAVYECTHHSGDVVPIGRPIPATPNEILDADLQRVPVGIPGELHIGGPGVAQGYLNQPELTAERFIADPFSRAPGARLYRTGDLCCRRADGNIEFLGRTDDQVKIRGFRIEPGEIEDQLHAHPSVEIASVVARPIEDTAGQASSDDLRLVAYVQSNGGPTATTGEYRQFLQDRLPAHMIPSVFVVLDRLPQLPNGKIDRAALPTPDAESRLQPSQATAKPRNETEQVLARVWADVLGVGRVGIDDNFFDLGGDSILSLQIVARARQAGVHVTPQQAFEHPTVGELAAAAQGGSAVAVDQALVTGPVILAPAQQWLLDQDLPSPHYWNQAFVLLVPTGIGQAALESALNALVLHHDALRLRFTREAYGWQQTNAGPDAEVRLAQVDLSSMAPEQQRSRVEALATELQGSIDLAEGLMLRAMLVRTGGATDRLVVAIHHLAVDAVSWRILMEDTETACMQRARGEDVELPSRTTSYQAWAEKLAALTRAGTFDEELAFWSRQVATAPLPVDYPADRANTERYTQTLVTSLSRHETQSLLDRLGAMQDVRVEDILLTTLVQTIAQWTGDTSCRIALEQHGRQAPVDDIDLSRTVGWFTALFPLTLDLPDASDPADPLRVIADQLRQIPSGGVGYGWLRYHRDDAPVRQALAALGEPELLFNYLGRLDQPGSEALRFRLTTESPGPLHSPDGQRGHLLECEPFILDGCLHIEWIYSDVRHRAQTVERLAAVYLGTLRQFLADQNVPTDAPGESSTFPNSGLRAAQLADLLIELTEQQRITGAGDLETIYPLAPMQLALLFQSLKAGESDPGFLQLSWIMRGDLDVHAFEQAWQIMVDRQPVLRTAMWWTDIAQPIQMVHRHVTLSVEHEDWSDVADDEIESRLQTFLVSDRQRGLDLSVAPTMRVTIIRHSPDAVRCVWSCHHTMLDGWSGALVLGELFAVYDGLLANTEPSLAPPTPYEAYIRWLDRQPAADAREFWRTTLEGYEVNAPLGQVSHGGDEPHPHERQSLTLSEQETQQVQLFARQQRLTACSVVQGAWALILGCGLGDDDIVFGATVAGRPPELDQIETMVGMFTNVVPVRARIAPSQQVREWLKGILDQQLRRHPFEYASLAQIHEWTERPGGGNLFETLVVIENYPWQKATGGWSDSLNIEDFRGGFTTNVPLTLVATPADQLRLDIIYDPRRFAAATIAELLEAMRSQIGVIAAHPGGRVEQLSIPSVSIAADESDSRQSISAAAPRDHAPVAPRNIFERRLLEIWQELFDEPHIGVKDNFFDLGGQSLTAMRLFVEIEKRFGNMLPLSSIFEAPTIEGLAVRCQELLVTGDDGNAAVTLRAGGDQLPLFCIPGTHGHVLCFHPLTRHLEAGRPIYGLQLPGLRQGEAPLDTIEEIADVFIREIRHVQPAGPYYLVGYCLGGVIAYETACRLHAEGQEARLLGLIETFVPGAIQSRSRFERIKVHLKRFAARRGAERIEYIRERLFGRQESAPQQIDDFEEGVGVTDTIRKVAGAANRAAIRYKARPYAGPVTLFRAAEQPDWLDFVVDMPMNGWERLARGGVLTHSVPCDHIDVFKEPYVQTLARGLQDSLDRPISSGL